MAIRRQTAPKHGKHKPKRNKFNAAVQQKDKFRSDLERKVNGNIPSSMDKWYEALGVPFQVPATMKKYHPDFVLANGLIIEVKGIFSIEDRRKHLLVREQYPGIEIRIIFYQDGFLSPKRGDRTRTDRNKRYSDWCEMHDIEYVIDKEGRIPKEWLTGGPFNTDYLVFPEPSKRVPNPPPVKLIQGPKI